MTFAATFPGPIEDVFYSNEPKFLEFYLRKNPDKIEYGVAKSERINVNQGLNFGLRLPMEFIPDPWTIIEDQHDLDKEMKEREIKAKQEEDKRVIKEAEMLAWQ